MLSHIALLYNQIDTSEFVLSFTTVQQSLTVQNKPTASLKVEKHIKHFALINLFYCHLKTLLLILLFSHFLNTVLLHKHNNAGTGNTNN